MTKTQVAQQLAFVAAAYPERVEVTEVMVNIWYDAFTDFDPDTFASAIKAHIMANKWPPTIADINLEVRQPDYPTGAEAWGEVCAEIRSVGQLGSPTFSHPMVTVAVKSFGWTSLCDMTHDTATAIRAQFIKFYASHCQRGVELALQGGNRVEIEGEV